MNIFPLAGNIPTDAYPQSRQPVADLAMRAAQMYRAQRGGAGPAPDSRSSYASDSRSKADAADKTAQQQKPDAAPKVPPYAEEFFRGLQNIKPERVETVQEDGTIKVTYNYYKPLYEYMRTFSGKGDGIPSYPQTKNQLDLINWCRAKLMSDKTPGTSAPDLKQGLDQMLVCLMSMDYSVKQWMSELLMTGQEEEDERAFQM
jgi:hypothetical protein